MMNCYNICTCYYLLFISARCVMPGERKVTGPQKGAQPFHASLGYEAFGLPFAFDLMPQAPRPFLEGFLLKKHISL